MLADKLSHLKHVDRRLAAEYSLECSVSFDYSFGFRVLKFVLFDVGPQPLSDFSARDWL